MQPAYLPILVVCACIILYAISNLYRSGMCGRCGGRGAHRDDCPLRDKR